LSPGELGSSSVEFSLVASNQVTGSEALLVQEALQSMLQSAPFRTSKQCQDLLRYVVQHSLTGQSNLLRERVIGAQVFARSPDYDTANDPIVRARMAEVRKRLAQYYQNADTSSSPVRVVILPGHYLAQFTFSSDPTPTLPAVRELPAETLEHKNLPAVLAPAAPVPAAPEPARSRIWLLVVLLCAVAALLGAGGTILAIRAIPPKRSAFDDFWMPAMKSSMPVIVYTGTNVVYRLTPEFLDRYRRSHHLGSDGPEFVVDLKTAGPVDAHDLSSSSNAYVTTGDVSACSAITAMLAQHGKSYELRYAGDISPGDLHSAPIVLIGAFNNGWTLSVTNPLRFAFAGGDTIRDNYDHRRAWTVRVSPSGTTTDDYAIVSRLLGTDGREMNMIAAGIGEYGTQAASEFLSSPQKINAFAQSAPAGWAHKNFQMVMHVKVVDDVPAAVDIVAVHYW
jgi:hypothetical protein